MLKNLGLIMYIGFLRANQQMLREYDEQKEEIVRKISNKEIVLSAAALDREFKGRFERLFNDYFDRGMRASKGLVDSEVVRISDATKIPFKYNRDVIDLVNDVSVFRGFADDLYREGFKRGEIDRIKKFLLQSTYDNTDEIAVRNQLQKSFNLTKKRAQLLARSETARLKETTKIIHHNQESVKKEFDLIWDAVDDGATRPAHAAMEGKIRQADGYFYSSTFGPIKAPPIDGEYNCRCSLRYRRRK